MLAWKLGKPAEKSEQLGHSRAVQTGERIADLNLGCSQLHGLDWGTEEVFNSLDICHNKCLFFQKSHLFWNLGLDFPFSRDKSPSLRN